MPFRRPLTAFLGLAALTLALTLAFAFSPRVLAAASTPHVKASLVAADTSIQPGKSITLALRLVHDPHWHTYWQNPGTGLPTSINWTLPPGWQASPIQWPAPIVLKDKQGNVVGNGYEGDILLPITLTAPADAKPGTAAELRAAVDWLECEAICVPGSAKLTLSLAVRAEPPQPDPTWGEKIRATLAELPHANAPWQVAASRAGKTLTLTVTPANEAATARHTPANLHFFSFDDSVAYDQPQTAKPDGRGGFILTVPLAADASANSSTNASASAPAKLAGVLTSDNGWLPGNKLRGLAVSAPFTKAATPFSLRELASTLLLAFVGGLILNLMPCVFPVLGLKILGFVNQAGHERKRIVAHGLVFTLGVLLSFWALAGALALLRAGGSELGWGFQLQEPGFVFALAALLLVFALNMSGVFEFGLGATAVGSDLQQKSGYSGSFFTGVLATVVATPCSAPFLAPALGAALAVSTIESFAIFTAIAIGLSLPYLLLSLFPAAIKILPRPGAWMETFKQFMAFPLYATVGWLVWVLSGQVPDDALNAILGLVLIALGVWLYGRYHAPGAKPARVRFGLAALVALLVAGTAFGWPRPSKIEWQPWSPELVTKLRAENRPIYVDFTAKWCFTCQTNKKVVFGSSEVLRYFADHKVATLRADWTNRDPQITAELARFGRSAVPFNLVYLPNKPEPLVLPELLRPATVLDAFNNPSLQTISAR